MSVRVGSKRIRRNASRMSTKVYIRLITGLVVAGIFISESSVKDFSETQHVKLASKATSVAQNEVIQVSAGSKTAKTTGKESKNDTNPTISSMKVARTLHELLQEAIPEQIFGLANTDTNISEEPRLRSTSTLLNETASGQSRRVGKAVGKQIDGPIQHPEGTNASGTRVLQPLTKPKVSRNETHASKRPVRVEAKGHSPFRGVLPTEENKHLFEADNVTHLSFMLYRLIKTHNIRSVLDVPCKRSMLWMGDLLQVLEFEVPNFHYKCLAPDDRGLAEGVVRYQYLSSATVLKNEFPWASRLPKADLALCWYGLGFLPPHQSWSLLKALRAAGVRFALVPNYPEVRHNPGSGSASGRINVRRAPYRFNEPLRVVNNVSAQASTPKQLLFYDLEGIRDAL